MYQLLNTEMVTTCTRASMSAAWSEVDAQTMSNRIIPLEESDIHLL
ncbi:hypothetical protein GPB2148_3681 [marine gamma proteobacterium HTCC2148]|nr:hypothetical protein GPB2148_3681 [marine gamma proteobacterium HTCC2148]